MAKSFFRKIKYLISPVVTVAALFLFGFTLSCQPDYKISPDHIRVHLNAEPATLHPIVATDAFANDVNAYLFETLIDIDPDTVEYRPKLATHWEISEDKRTYTFYLRKDVKWHDGHPFTADDIIYSYNKIKDPEVNAPVLRTYFAPIESAKKINDYTVRFRYKDIYYKALSVIGFMSIVPKHILEKQAFEQGSFARAPVGMGPYKFKKWLTNKKILLERNEEYWGKKPAIKTIEFKILHDAAIGLQILKKGLIDVFPLKPLQWVKQTSSSKFNQRFRKLSYPGRNFSYVGWNYKSPFFGDKRVRQAMTMLIDREKFKEKLYYNLATLTTGPFFPHSAQHNTDLEPWPYNPERAKKLLAEAGWKDSNGDGVLDKDGKKFKFSFLYSSGSKFAENLASIMKEDLKEIGIQMNITRLEWATFLSRIDQKNFDAATLAWALPLESDPYQVWHSSQANVKGSSNFISFQNKEADRLIERARVIFDEERRNQLYWRFQEILHEEQPYTFLFSSFNLYTVSRRFDNVILHKLGLDLLDWEPVEP